MKVCHFTSAHESNDIRVFIKECRTLAKAGHDTWLVAQGESREEDGVHVIGMGKLPSGRRERMTVFAKSVYKKALELDCDIYHFHDPELLRYGLKLKKKGKKVIYDSHEDVPSQIKDKTWIPAPFRKLVSGVYKAYETLVVRHLDAVVAATPYIKEQFRGRVRRAATICNYPILEGIQDPVDYDARKLMLGYTGIRCAEDRGAREMVEAAVAANVRLDIYGTMEPESLQQELAKKDDKGVVHFHGLVPYPELQESMANMKIGLLVEHPTANAMNALCIKMFEYMAHGMVIISSDIPLWKEIIEDADCGVCVDPYDVKAITEVIRRLAADPAGCRVMAMNGFRMVKKKYSWESEARKLCRLYERLGSDKG